MRWIVLPLFIGAAPLGCETDPNSLADSEDAQRGFRAMLGALDSEQPAGLQRADGTSFRGGDLNPAGGDVDVVGGCPEGGTVHFDGSLEISGVDGDIDIPDIDPSDPGGVDPGDIDPSGLIPTINFDYKVGFDGCTVDGVTIDGEMTWSLATQWDQDAFDMLFDWSYEGQVDFTGAVEGTCVFDLGGTNRGDADDWQDVDPSGFEGDLCGFEGEELGD